MWCNGGWQAHLLFGQIHLGGGWWGAAEVSAMPRRKEGEGGAHSQTQKHPVPGSRFPVPTLVKSGKSTLCSSSMSSCSPYQCKRRQNKRGSFCDC
jgi:hypothetical protein